MERKKCSQNLALELELWKLNKVHGRLLGRGRAKAKMEESWEEAMEKTFDAAAKPVRWNLRQGRSLRLCTCKDEFLEPKQLFPTRKIAELNARFKEQFLNERLEVAECPEGCGFHLSEWLPKKASGTSVTICNCKDKAGKPVAIFWTRALAEELLPERRACAKKSFKVCKCVEGKGYHLASEEDETRWRREKQNRDLREGRDEPLGDAFGGIFGTLFDEPGKGARA